MGWHGQSSGSVCQHQAPSTPNPSYGHSHEAEEGEEGGAETEDLEGLGEAPPAEGKALQGPSECRSDPCTPTQTGQETQPTRTCSFITLLRSSTGCQECQCFILKEGTASISLCSPSKLPAPHSSCMEPPSCGGTPSQPRHFLVHRLHTAALAPPPPGWSQQSQNSQELHPFGSDTLAAAGYVPCKSGK